MDYYEFSQVLIIVLIIICIIIESFIYGFKRKAIVQYSVVFRSLAFWGIINAFVISFIDTIILFILLKVLTDNRILIIISMHVIVLISSILWNKDRKVIDVYGIEKEKAEKVISEILTKEGIKNAIIETKTDKSIVQIQGKEALVKIKKKEYRKGDYVQVKFIKFRDIDKYNEIINNICSTIESISRNDMKVRGLNNLVIAIVIIMMVAFKYYKGF